MQTAAIHLRHLTQGLAALLLMLTASILHAAEERATSVVFFADHLLSDAQWSALLTQVQDQLQAYRSETQSASSQPEVQPRLDLLRGDQLQPGLIVDSAVSVYLHGNCSSIPVSLAPVFSSSPHPGALGWVALTEGHITPFIHIDCALISHVLRSSSLFLAADRRDLVSIAIARVFLHEWLHIETQSPHHTHAGIAKSTFSAEDLIDHTQSTRAHRNPHPRKHSEEPALSPAWHGK